MENLLELEKQMWRAIGFEIYCIDQHKEDERDYYRQVEMETKEEYERDAEW